MKIFSLETKKHLVGWAIVLGFIINIIILKTVLFKESCSVTPEDSLVPWAGLRICKYSTGIPFRVVFNYFELRNDGPVHNLNYFLNIVFWIFVVLIVLSVVRHFRKKSNQNIISKR